MKPSHLTILTVSFRAFLCTLVTLSAGYSFGTVNHGFQLPMIRYFQGDTLLSQDLLLEIIPAYTTYFFKVIALLNLNYSSLELLFFTLYILSIYALFHALILAFDLIGKHPEYSLLAALAIAAGFLPVLGLKPWQYQLDHSIPGIAMAAWAIYFFLAKREKSAFVTLGTLFNIHALYAAHLFILFGLYLLYRFPWKKFSFADLRPNLELIGLFSILAFPIILWKTTSMTPDESITADWIQALHDVLWYQVFFSDTPYQLLILFTVFIAALLLSLIIIEKNTQLTPAMDRTRVLIYLSLLFCAIQIIFTDLIPLRIALEGQFWRTTQWTAMFGALIIMLALNRQAEQTDIPYSRWMAWSGAALIIMNSLISLILAGLMLIVGTRSTSKATSTINSRLAFSALSISLIIGTAFSTWYWRIDRDFAATLRYPDGNFSNAMLALAAIAYLYLIHKKHHKIAAITILSAVIIQGFLWGKQREFNL